MTKQCLRESCLVPRDRWLNASIFEVNVQVDLFRTSWPLYHWQDEASITFCLPMIQSEAMQVLDTWPKSWSTEDTCGSFALSSSNSVGDTWKSCMRNSEPPVHTLILCHVWLIWLICICSSCGPRQLRADEAKDNGRQNHSLKLGCWNGYFWVTCLETRGLKSVLPFFFFFGMSTFELTAF